MVRRLFIRNRAENLEGEASPLVRLWALRMLVALGGHRKIMTTDGVREPWLLGLLGLSQWADDSAVSFKLASARSDLFDAHNAAEATSSEAELPGLLCANVTRIAALVGLDETDCAILAFTAMLHTEEALETASEALGELSSIKLYRALAVVLGLDQARVGAALSLGGALLRSGLMSLDRDYRRSLRDRMRLLSGAFADALVESDGDPMDFLRSKVSLATPGHMNLEAYDHIQPELELLRPFLKHSLAIGRKGVNIMLHGAPGTGKSQLARALAADLGCELFDVASEDEEGDPIQGEGRLSAYRAAQHFFGQRRALIVFDEGEDAFNDGGALFGRKSTAQVRKAWINRSLEENSVPTLWIFNAIDSLDPAFVRRFDMVIELPVPSRRQREKIIRETCGELLDAGSLVRLASAENLAPAVIARASAVVRAIRDRLEPNGATAALERLVSSTLQAQGHGSLRAHDANRLPEFYDPSFARADVDLGAVASGLVASRSGRLCLYGPPGTGKTAYGRWLADQLGVPLIVKRASDLISPYVGETERNIARAFREASQEDSVLLIDEVDSFLQDRRRAQQSWQVSEVNEMLTQMEAFSGIFIATTNLMDGLDQAAMRRFDLKVKLDFLSAEQAWELACRHCSALGLQQPDSSLRSRFNRQRHLTPGDFAAVARQHRFRPIQTVEMLVAALEAECAVKVGAQAPIGFVI